MRSLFVASRPLMDVLCIRCWSTCLNIACTKSHIIHRLDVPDSRSVPWVSRAYASARKQTRRSSPSDSSDEQTLQPSHVSDVEASPPAPSGARTRIVPTTKPAQRFRGLCDAARIDRRALCSCRLCLF